MQMFRLADGEHQLPRYPVACCGEYRLSGESIVVSFT